MIFQKGNKQTLRQVFLRGTKFFEKEHIVFPPIYCQKQQSKGALRNNCSALVVKNLEKYFKDFYIQILVLPTFEINQTVTILK